MPRISEEVRRAIQQSPESDLATAKKHGVNLKTVRRWRARTSVQAKRPGPKAGSSSALSEREQFLILAVRQWLNMPLDDCVYVMKPIVPKANRSSIYRTWLQHGLSRVSREPAARSPRGTFDLHLVEGLGGGGIPSLFVAVERTSKYWIVHCDERPAGDAVGDFLDHLVLTAPVAVSRLAWKRDGALSRHNRAISEFCRNAGIKTARAAAAAEHPADDDPVGTFAASRAGQVIGEDRGEFRATLSSLAEHHNIACRLKSLGGRTPLACLEGGARRLAGPAPAPLPGGRNAAPGQVESRGSADMREHILRCARSLMATSGPDSLTISKVAHLAGLNRGAIYRHFGSRMQLVVAAAEWASAQLVEAVFGGEIDSADLERSEDVLGVMPRLMDFAIRNPVMSQAWLYQVLASSEPSKDRFWREYVRRSEAFHRTEFSAGNIDAEVLAVILLAGSFLWPTFARATTKDEAELSRLAERFNREIYRLALHGTMDRAHFKELLARPTGRSLPPELQRALQEDDLGST